MAKSKITELNKEKFHSITKVIRSLTAMRKKHWYPLLLTAVGGISIYESIRLTNKYHPKHWLSGTSGFIMILGLAMVALLVVDSIMRAVRAEKKECDILAVRATSCLEELPEELLNEEAGEDEAAFLTHNRKMWVSFGFLLAFALLIQKLGFTLSSTVYLGANMRLLNNSWRKTIITTSVLFLFLLFGAPFLGISFPRGLLGI